MTIDNTNLLQMCHDCGAVGFVPAVAYTYDAGAGNVTVTNSSTIPSGDTLKKVKVRVHDMFGGEVRGFILVGAGGDGYDTAPLVSFTGGGGSGATGHAVITNGRVTSIVIDTPGSSYETPPTVVFDNTGTNGSGAAGTAVLSGDAVDSVTLTADDTAVTLNVSTLDRSKQLAISVTVLTTNHIAADGGAYGLNAAGNIGHWDVQKNAQ